MSSLSMEMSFEFIPTVLFEIVSERLFMSFLVVSTLGLILSMRVADFSLMILSAALPRHT